jgi:hypothetical protein
MWWLTPIIPTTWKVDLGGSKFEASPGKKLVRAYLKATWEAEAGESWSMVSTMQKHKILSEK